MGLQEGSFPGVMVGPRGLAVASHVDDMMALSKQGIEGLEEHLALVRARFTLGGDQPLVVPGDEGIYCGKTMARGPGGEVSVSMHHKLSELQAVADGDLQGYSSMLGIVGWMVSNWCCWWLASVHSFPRVNVGEEHIAALNKFIASVKKQGESLPAWRIVPLAPTPTLVVFCDSSLSTPKRPGRLGVVVLHVVLPPGAKPPVKEGRVREVSCPANVLMVSSRALQRSGRSATLLHECLASCPASDAAVRVARGCAEVGLSGSTPWVLNDHLGWVQLWLGNRHPSDWSVFKELAPLRELYLAGEVTPGWSPRHLNLAHEMTIPGAQSLIRDVVGSNRLVMPIAG
jgi:hypothetical protein